ncbi:MAG TPA: serine dehydratase [Balneola sp.]|jgi:threonine dehydratase|nr:serine dehydratase [Bacteroidota bacterium]MAC04615.1 serine dehydratase [Balneola sp.]MAO76291.1 serine dehydratase [Balneola sp.]MBF65482.1 serine dehydratase [Balneola sp.]HAH49927.1 serine dehydratase [Balneola sp.]|tara:strand:- start:22376 stop:23332 length:957 start_codon:yes stop_codon:yes gene_type:complete
MIDTLSIPTLSDIKAAHQVIDPYAHRTPVLSSNKVNIHANASVFFKCENFQKVGAFKFRGACNAVLTLSDKDAEQGVATHSSGNHAQALALAARIRGIKAYVVMPENAPKVKVEAVKNYGAEVTFCEASLDAREGTLKKVVERTGATTIHPYNDARIIAGQGTSAIEFLEECPFLDVIMTPIGGGGLLSGTALAAKSINPDIEIIGTEPKEADDAYRSFKEGKLIPAYSTHTIADGLRTSLGELPFQIIQKNVDDILTVDEESIISAMRFIWERMNMIIEPSCAVPVAALFNNQKRFVGKKVGIIITGGNVDLDNLPW